MIPILSSDSYRGFSTNLLLSSATDAQPAFVGRLIWPDAVQSEDAVFKLYKTDTCGIANELIGYLLNKENRIAQPKLAAIVLLTPENLNGISLDLADYTDSASGMIACWTTSFEQETKPFKFARRLSTFTNRQIKAFYKSQFCKGLSIVDHVTGNNDRHEGNFLYKDDLHYLAIDQGCVGGGLYWHKTWPDRNARNELLALAHLELSTHEWKAWASETLVTHNNSSDQLRDYLQKMKAELASVLDDDAQELIVEYMSDRATDATFATSCGRLI